MRQHRMAAYERIVRRLIMTGLCRPMNHEIPGSVRGVASLPVAVFPARPVLRSSGLRAVARCASSRDRWSRTGVV